MIEPHLVKELFALIEPYSETREANTPKALALLAAHPELVNVCFGDFGVPEPTWLSIDTPLHIAARGLNVDLVRQLIALGGDVNAQLPKGGMTALMFAVQVGYSSDEQRKKNKLRTIELLLEAGADPNLARHDGETALHDSRIVDMKIYPDVVKLLLQYGANPNAKDEGGFAPISYRQCSAAALLMMIEAGADVNLARRDGSTPLMHTIKDCGSEEVEILLAHGADVHARGKFRNTALHYASSMKWHSKSVEMLLKAGAKPNLKQREGYTPLHIAASNSVPQSVRLLLAAGADVNARNQKKETPLALAEAAMETYGPDEKAQETILLLKQAGGAR